MDGKALFSTATPGNPYSADLTSGGVIRPREVPHEKTSEIPVLQILACLDADGKTVTAGARHCQRETCRCVMQHKGDYLFGLNELLAVAKKIKL